MKAGVSLYLTLVITVSFLIVLVPPCYDMLMQFDRQLHRKVTSLGKGTTKSETLLILGEPIRTGAECCLPQATGYESEFAKAEKSNAAEFLLWRNGINWFYCIGFDKDERLLIILEGSS